MARINKELIILVGRDRENPRTHREAFQITGGLGEMLDKHIKRNNLNKSEFIREAVAAKLEAEMQKEPLIKDEKIRKAVRAWAEANDVEEADYWNSDYRFQDVQGGSSICFESNPIETKNRYGNDVYTIAELCGEEEE